MKPPRLPGTGFHAPMAPAKAILESSEEVSMTKLAWQLIVVDWRRENALEYPLRLYGLSPDLAASQIPSCSSKRSFVA